MSTNDVLAGSSGRWVRRGGSILLFPGGPAGELEGEAAATAPPGGPELVHDPELGYGWRSSGPAQAEVGETGWTGAGGAGEGEEEIIGPDGRVRVRTTREVPYRFICRLRTVFADPAGGGRTRSFAATGTLISDRHVLTSAHVLRKTLSGGGSTLRTASSVTARPGLNLATAPFGSSASTTLRTPAGWDGTSPAHDFGLVTLADDLGAQRHAVLGKQPLGFWGSRARGAGTRIRALEDGVLRGAALNLSGYPADKCGTAPARGSATPAELSACGPGLHASTQWRAFGTLTRLTSAGSPGNVLYDMDSAGGQSGAPVWLRWQQVRILTAVHKGRLPAGDPDRGRANRGVRITEAVLRQLREWMRADGVEPAF